jgi:hypothetical protein
LGKINVDVFLTRSNDRWISRYNYFGGIWICGRRNVNRPANISPIEGIDIGKNIFTKDEEASGL